MTYLVPQNLFSGGEIGPFMGGRADSQLYIRSAAILENWLLLPHGGLQRRPGFEYVDTLTGDAGQLRLGVFNFNRTQMYVLVFGHETIKVFRNKALVATVAAPWGGTQLRDIRWAQSGDTMILVHPEHAPRKLERTGSDSSWSLVELEFKNRPFHRYEVFSSVTPSGTTGSITLTLSGTTNGWKAGHVGTRVKLNSGVATIDSISSSTVANATVNTNLSGTAADPSWSEWAWSSARGFGRTVHFHENRMVFGGMRDAPATLFGSKSSDFFNFDDSDTKDDFAYKFTLSSNQVNQCRDLLSQTAQLNIFTSDGEFTLTGSQGNAITPTNVKVTPQSSYGCSDIPVVEIDGEILLNTANQKEIRSFKYNLQADRYLADSKTTVAHHLFVNGKFPRAMAYLRSYRDTQSNLLAVVREDGEIAVMSIDRSRDIDGGWCRWNSQGDFKDVCVAVTDHGDGIEIETLYAIVDRENGVFLECLTEEEVYVDSWIKGTSGTPKADWSGATTLANQLCQVNADGLVHAPVTVNAAGEFTLDRNVSTVYVGLGYTSTAETLKITIAVDGQIKRGSRIAKKRAILDVLDTLALTVDGYDVGFRAYGANLLDAPLTPFSGTKEVRIRGISKDPSVVITCDQPVSATVLTLTTEIDVAA